MPSWHDYHGIALVLSRILRTFDCVYLQLPGVYLQLPGVYLQLPGVYLQLPGRYPPLAELTASQIKQ